MPLRASEPLRNFSEGGRRPEANPAVGELKGENKEATMTNPITRLTWGTPYDAFHLTSAAAAPFAGG
jgi:hypothetical protein